MADAAHITIPHICAPFDARRAPRHCGNGEAIAAAVIPQKLWAKSRAFVLNAWHCLVGESHDDMAMIVTQERENRSLKPRETTSGESFIEEARRINCETVSGYQPDKRILVLPQSERVVGGVRT